jgi:hypothetical protein
VATGRKPQFVFGVRTIPESLRGHWIKYVSMYQLARACSCAKAMSKKRASTLRKFRVLVSQRISVSRGWRVSNGSRPGKARITSYSRTCRHAAVTW